MKGMSWGIWGFETFRRGLLIKEDAGGGWSRECAQAGQRRSAGFHVAASDPPANERTSITLQLVGIRLRFTHTRSASGHRGGVWTVGHAASSQRRKSTETHHTYLWQCLIISLVIIILVLIIIIWSSQKTSSNFGCSSSLRCRFCLQIPKFHFPGVFHKW